MDNYKEIPGAALESLFLVPEYYLLEFSGNHAHFVRMDRNTYHESIFTDSQRIVTADSEIYRIEIVKLLELFEARNASLPAVQFIFHVAHCGSTLLARALDRPGHNLVYREPSALRQLAVAYNPMEPLDAHSMWSRCLRMLYALLSRTFEASQPVIIKANVPVNFILPEILSVNPESSAILLYSDLESFLIAALKSQERRHWVSNVLKELATNISRSTMLPTETMEGLSPGAAAACIWLAQINRFNNIPGTSTRIRSLNCDTLYDSPVETLRCAFDFLNQDVTDNEVQEIVSGELFSSYSKSPGMRYTNQDRLDEKLKNSSRLADEISEGTEWIKSITGNTSISETLPFPLVLTDSDEHQKIKISKPGKGYTVKEPGAAGTIVEIHATEDNPSLAMLDKSEVIGLFKQYGVILFRDFQVEQQSLNTMTSQYCSGFVMSKTPNRSCLSDDGRTQSVNLNANAFPLHPEMSQVPWRPDIAWFACANPPKTSGETMLCDGIALVDRLNPEIRRQLENRLLLYKREAEMAECEYILGIKNPSSEELEKPRNKRVFSFSIENDKLFRSFITPVFHKPMFSSKPAFGAFLLFRRQMYALLDYPTFGDGSIIPDEIFNEIKAASESLTVEHTWKQGDLLMIDNTRFMHGRRKVDVEHERRIATQFGYASFRPDYEIIRKSQPWRQDASMLLSELSQRTALIELTMNSRLTT